MLRNYIVLLMAVIFSLFLLAGCGDSEERLTLEKEKLEIEKERLELEKQRAAQEEESDAMVNQLLNVDLSDQYKDYEEKWAQDKIKLEEWKAAEAARKEQEAAQKAQDRGNMQ